MLPSTVFSGLKNQAGMREATVEQVQLTAGVPIPPNLLPSRGGDLAQHVQMWHLTEDVHSLVF